ncbi:MAG: hypothetical protein LUC16_00330 [Coprobacillus sp.]|nr:hypothetical protein [Coprobacillus sp.]
MKKENVLGLIVYLIILVFAVVFGLTVLQDHFSRSALSTGMYILYVLGAIVAGIVVNAILYEVGHVIGAKLGRYQVYSVNILGFCFYKVGEKTKLKLQGFDGLSGETKITPREDADKEPNPRWYLFMGLIIYAAEIIIIMIFFSIYRNSEVGSVALNTVYFFLIIGVIGAVIVIYNILPFRLDTMTDGYKLTMTSNKINCQAYNALLKSEYYILQGAESVELPTFEQITDFTADLNLNKVYLLLDDKKYEEAETLLDQIINSKENVTEKTYIRTSAQKIYINIMYKSIDEAKEYYATVSPEIRRLISTDKSMPCVRAYLVMSGVLDRSQSECLQAIKSTDKAFKATPENRQHTELVLFNEAILKVDELHPEWGLKSHLLKESSKKNSSNKK